jgi:hypothetical protein
VLSPVSPQTTPAELPDLHPPAMNERLTLMDGPSVDPIVEDIRKIREGHAARFNCDVNAIADDLKRRQEERGVSVVSRPPKPVSGAKSNADAPPALNQGS